MQSSVQTIRCARNRPMHSTWHHFEGPGLSPAKRPPSEVLAGLLGVGHHHHPDLIRSEKWGIYLDIYADVMGCIYTYT